MAMDLTTVDVQRALRASSSGPVLVMVHQESHTGRRYGPEKVCSDDRVDLHVEVVERYDGLEKIILFIAPFSVLVYCAEKLPFISIPHLHSDFHLHSR